MGSTAMPMSSAGEQHLRIVAAKAAAPRGNGPDVSRATRRSADGELAAMIDRLGCEIVTVAPSSIVGILSFNTICFEAIAQGCG
jgi:hypothetical protein